MMFMASALECTLWRPENARAGLWFPALGNQIAAAAVEVRALSVSHNPPVDWSEGRIRRAPMSNIDPWEKAADCERARKSAADPEQRRLLANLRDLWIALGCQCELMD